MCYILSNTSVLGAKQDRLACGLCPEKVNVYAKPSYSLAYDLAILSMGAQCSLKIYIYIENVPVVSKSVE